MRYEIPINRENKVRKILDIFDHLQPFSTIAARERDVLAEYVNEYYKLTKNINDEQIAAILFDYDFTRRISERLNISMDMVRNYASKLRKKKLLNGKIISKNVLILFDSIDSEITFKLKFKN